MIYLSQLLGNPVYDLDGEQIGKVNDLGIATGEVFPRVTSLAIVGPGKTPFMLSWRKYVDTFSDKEVRLKVIKTDIRFSYLQPDEVLIARDLLDKQIVDTRGMRVVRVNDLKLSDTNSTQLRLLGAPRSASAASCARSRRTSSGWPCGWARPSATPCPSASSRGTTWTCSTATSPTSSSP